MSDDVQWRVHRPSPVAGTYTGIEEVLGFFPRMLALYEGTLQVEVNAIAADSGHGFVLVAESASTRRGSGLDRRSCLGLPRR
jgi:hypothetical protein